jgi:hypothetical protein
MQLFVSPQVVEERLIPHVDGDEHSVADAFRNRGTHRKTLIGRRALHAAEAPRAG